MKSVPMLLCLLALGGCSNKPPQPQAKTDHVATPFDAMKADEQRARDVQKTVDASAEQQRHQIEAQQQ
jgi:hypothetical protein